MIPISLSSQPNMGNYIPVPKYTGEDDFGSLYLTSLIWGICKLENNNFALPNYL
jgi:hypothetical protein